MLSLTGRRMEPHNALRIVEAKIHKLDSYIGDKDPVWTALDQLWKYMVAGNGTPKDN